MKVEKRTIISLGIVGVGLSLVLLLSIVVIPKVMVTLTKAAPTMKVSLRNSYFIGGKILARADGVDKCVVNVFVLDETGKGIRGKRVGIMGLGEARQVVSGADGQASFGLTSTVEGQFDLEASIEGVPLAKKVKITFRGR